VATEHLDLGRIRPGALELLVSFEHVVSGLGARVMDLDQTERQSGAAGKTVGSVG
jgi:hypothetical protein